MELEIPVYKKIEVIIVEHIAYEGHEDAELKYTGVASKIVFLQAPKLIVFTRWPYWFPKHGQYVSVQLAR